MIPLKDLGPINAGKSANATIAKTIYSMRDIVELQLRDNTTAHFNGRPLAERKPGTAAGVPRSRASPAHLALAIQVVIYLPRL